MGPGLALCRPCQVAANRAGTAPARAGAQTRAGGPQGIARGTAPRKRSQSRVVMRWIGIVLFITAMLGLKALSVGVSIGLVSLGEPTKDRVEVAKETVSGYEISYTAYRQTYPDNDEDEEEGEGEGEEAVEAVDADQAVQARKRWEPVWVKKKDSSGIETLIIYYDFDTKLYDYSRYSKVDHDDVSLFSTTEEEEHDYELEWKAEPEKGWKHRGHYLVSCEFDGEPYSFHLEFDRKDRKNPKPIVTGTDANGKAILALAGQEIKWKPIEREDDPHDPRYTDAGNELSGDGTPGEIPESEITDPHDPRVTDTPSGATPPVAGGTGSTPTPGN